MARDRFPDIPLRFLQRLPRGHTARQIRNVCGPVGFCLLENDGVFSVHSFSSRPAALRIDFKVPFGNWSPRCPGIVTTLGFDGCLYWRWLPVVRTCRQPSDSTTRLPSQPFPCLPSTLLPPP